MQEDPIPYLGGLAMVVAFVAAMFLGSLVRGVEGSYDKVAVILGGGLALAAMGLVDDLRPIPGWAKAAVIVPLAVVLHASGVRAEPFEIWQLNFIITVGWVAGIVNAINFLDNMDGLTAGTTAIAAGFFTVLAGLSGQAIVGGLSAAVTGCALGFLWYNRPPARIFMGDAGSHFLGWVIAALARELRFDNLARFSLLVPIAILGVPVFDTLLVSVSRIRKGHSPLRPGLDHTSHRLVKLGASRGAAVGRLYLAAFLCGLLGVGIAHVRPQLAYVVMGFLVAAGLYAGVQMLQVRTED